MTEEQSMLYRCFYNVKIMGKYFTLCPEEGGFVIELAIFGFAWLLIVFCYAAAFSFLAK